jgi:integrase/recombinase XerD
MRSPRTPLESVIESYLLHCHDLQPRTRVFYSDNLLWFLRWLRANNYAAVLSDVEPGAVNQYLVERRRVSPFTARAAGATLKAFATWLASVGIRHQGGLSVLRHVRTPRVPQDVRRPLSPGEVALVLRAAEGSRNGERDYALLLVALDCGLRLNELCELERDDVDFSASVLTVRAETSKSNRTRQVRIGRQSARALDRYVKDFREEAADLPSGTRRVFLSDNGRPMNGRGMGQIFRRIGRRSGLRQFSAHICRHTWATEYRRREAGDLYDLQAEGGWRDLGMVRRYAHQLPLAERRRGPSPMDALLRDQSGRVRESQRESVALRVVKAEVEAG